MKVIDYSSPETQPGAAPTTVGVERPGGRQFQFVAPASGNTYVNDPDVSDRLVRLADQSGATTGWTYTVASDDEVETYDASGNLASITTRAGVTETLAYSTSSTPTSVAPWPGLLISVSDSFGHQIQFVHDAQGRVTSVTDPAGNAYALGYDAASSVVLAGHPLNNDLTSITYPDGHTKSFYYNEQSHTSNANLPGNLTGVVDESGNRFEDIYYATWGGVYQSQRAGGTDKITLSFGTNAVTVTSYISDPNTGGTPRTYDYSPIQGVNKITSLSALCPSCTTHYSTATFDANGNFASTTDHNGNQTLYTFDLTRNLQTSRTEGSGTPAARTITTQWSVSYHLPALISEYAGGTASGTPIRTTGFSYDGSGNLLTKTITDPATGAAHTWTYTYDSYGRMLTADGPRTDVSDVTTYTYYTCTTGSQCGELETVTDALGHVTTYNTYDANGRPLTITDPNGVVATLTYDARGHLKSRSAAGETASFSYYPTGLLEQVTLPDGGSLSYAYDAAHRLTQVTDGLGNKIVYTLDAMGNRTAENTYDPSGALHGTHSRVINALNQIYQEVNAAGTGAVTTTFGYDNDGNPTSIAAPLSRNSADSYDALNRVSSITDPGTGVTTFGYDAEDDLTSVKDPRNLTTSYGYDGFGNLTSLVSPDTGTTTNTYDSAGNLATATDARGAVATYGYDALNRVTSIAYSLGGSTDQTLSFTYDQGTDGIGHLTGASDANHSMSFSYDALGEKTGMSQIVGGVTRSTAYGYTSGNLVSITTPSGQTVTYGYNANHQVTSIAVNGTTVLSNVSYEPFGPVNGWAWGNGTSLSRAFSGDGLITGISSPGSQETLSYDDASRISGITNTASGASSWTYGFDTLDRLTSATSSSVTQGWTYDANGNRLSETGAFPSTYSTSSASNRITGISGTLTRTYVYDAAGNTLGDSTDTDTYNGAGRLKTVTNTSGTTTFIYDALGQMIEANGPSGATLYAYDQAGHLLGEYDGSGNLIQETVWLGNIPVATLHPNGSSIAIYYVVTDQIETPREVIRPSDNALMWTWFSGPFGVEAPNENPQGIGTFVYDLRFPGQVAGTWSSTYQNYFRDFDPAVGRYMESDPLGLAGGSYSTYAYANGNPVSNSDPLGLLSPRQDWGCLPGQSWGNCVAANPPSVPPGPCAGGPRAPDFMNFNINAYVFSVYGIFTSNGYAYVGGGVNFTAPNPLLIEASVNAGWLNTSNPSGAQIDNFVSNYSGGVVGGYYGVGGGEVWSPGNGTATVIGVGAGAQYGTSFGGGANGNWGYTGQTGYTGITW